MDTQVEPDANRALSPAGRQEYELYCRIIRNGPHTAEALGEARATAAAAADAFLVVAVIIVLGALTSLVRGEEEAQSEPVT